MLPYNAATFQWPQTDLGKRVFIRLSFSLSEQSIGSNAGLKLNVTTFPTETAMLRCSVSVFGSLVVGLGQLSEPFLFEYRFSRTG